MHTPGIITKSFSPSLPPTRHLHYPQMGCPHHPPFTEPPDSVAPEALPPAPKCVLCRIGPFALGVAPAGDSGWKRNLLSPWKRGKTPRQGVGGGWVVLEGGAKTDGKVGPQTPDTSGQLVWGRNLRLSICTQDTLPEPRGCSGPVGRGSAGRQLPGVWRRTGFAK